MVSTSLQVSLLHKEVNLLAEEAAEQQKVEICKHEEAIAEGRLASNIKRIVPSTVATQIIRKALPALEAKWANAKKEKVKG